MPGKGKHSEKWHRCWDKVQSQGHDSASAAAICTKSLGEESYNEESMSKSESRDVHLVAAAGKVRTGTYRGRPHLVVPVTALVEGVLHAVNSETPELVLAEEFGIAYNGWNGRPVVLNHPELNGKKVSANDPEVLERHQVGRAFNTRMSSSALDTELWVDPERAAGLGKEGHRLLERIEAEDPNDPLEVSVGVFILPEARAGEYNGKKYQAVWRHIVQDHIAILSDGKVGACSVSMGCGTRWMTSADGYERVGGTVPRNDDTVPAMLAPGERMLTPEEQRAACDCGSIKLGDVKIANTIVADTIIKHVLGRR